jgi:hypothetical protein
MRASFVQPLHHLISMKSPNESVNVSSYPILAHACRIRSLGALFLVHGWQRGHFILPSMQEYACVELAARSLCISVLQMAGTSVVGPTGPMCFRKRKTSRWSTALVNIHGAMTSRISASRLGILKVCCSAYVELHCVTEDAEIVLGFRTAVFLCVCSDGSTFWQHTPISALFR